MADEWDASCRLTDGSEIKCRPKPELLFEENLERFNQLVAQGRAPDLRGQNLSSLDLRRARLRGLDLSGCYLRNANLRGVDMTGCNLNGASMQGAMISGAWLPADVSAEEVRLSVDLGTRIRTFEAAGHLKAIVKLLHKLAGPRSSV